MQGLHAHKDRDCMFSLLTASSQYVSIGMFMALFYLSLRESSSSFAAPRLVHWSRRWDYDKGWKESLEEDVSFVRDEG